MSPKRPGKRRAAPAGKRLTPQEQLFCEELRRTKVAAQAAIRAGYAPQRAKVFASELRRRPHIRAYLEQLEAARKAETETPVDDRPLVEDELRAVGFADIRDIATFGSEGLAVRPSNELPMETAAAIRKVRFRPTKYGDEIEVELHDKLSALGQLQRLKRMIPAENPWPDGWQRPGGIPRR